MLIVHKHGGSKKDVDFALPTTCCAHSTFLLNSTEVEENYSLK